MVNNSPAMIFTFETLATNGNGPLVPINFCPTVCTGYILLIVLLFHMESLAALEKDFKPLHTYVIVDFTLYFVTQCVCYCCASFASRRMPLMYIFFFAFSALQVVGQLVYAIHGA